MKAVGFDPSSDNALDFVRLVLDFFHPGDQTGFGEDENFIGSSENIVALLLGRKIQRRAEHGRVDQALTERGEASIGGPHREIFQILFRIETEVLGDSSRGEMRDAAKDENRRPFCLSAAGPHLNSGRATSASTGAGT